MAVYMHCCRAQPLRQLGFLVRRSHIVDVLQSNRTHIVILITSVVVGWRRGVVVNALVVINEVTLRRARLVLGRVTVCGRINHLGM